MNPHRAPTPQDSSSPHLTKKAKEEDHQETDAITNLPQDIRLHILSFLPAKHAVCTTVLSKKWTNLWASASFPNLDLDDRLLLLPKTSTIIHSRASSFASFVDRVLSLAPLPCTRKLTLSCSLPHNPTRISSWLCTACKSHLVEVEINVFHPQNPIELPPNLYVSTSLAVLKLNANIRLDFPPNSLYFPSLKVLWIKIYRQHDVNVTQRLFCDHICPVLEDLFIEDEILDENNRKVVFLVLLNSLKRLKIEYHLVHSIHGNDIECSFVVHCPNLECLDLCGDFLAKYNVKEYFKVLGDAKICIGHPSADYGAFELYNGVEHSNSAFELLEALSNVKALSLSGSTTGAVNYSYETAQHTDPYDNEDENALLSRLRNFQLNFPFLTCLELGFRTLESWNLLTLLLHRSPNLEYLVLKKELKSNIYGYKRAFIWTPKGSVPECLLFHLKEIEIWGFEGKLHELAVVEFFLGHSEVLQKMTIHVQELSPDTEVMLCQHVMEFPRASESCKMEIV